MSRRPGDSPLAARDGDRVAPPSSPPRIAFWHRKGGTGKTSLALGCAIWMARRGQRILLLDIDPQGSAATWGERHADRWGLAVRADSGHDPWREGRIPASHFEAILIDCPPQVSPEVVSLLAGVDRLVIPTRPAWPDLWALDAVAGILADLHAAGARLTTQVLFNQVDTEDLDPFVAAARALGLAIHPAILARDPAWPALFDGGLPPASVERLAESLIG